jgi:menaquinone-dependent protoporphyrinogen oxidase
MSILVVYGSSRGGTEGLAQMVGQGLRQAGFGVEVLNARRVKGVAGYQAVIVGGALYTGRWHPDARRFVKRNQRELRTMPTYFFSSGPLDDSAVTGDVPPVRGVRALMQRVGAHGHVTFGGRLAPDARGFPAAAMAKKLSGDWRDPQQVESWVTEIASAVAAEAVRVEEQSSVST